MTEKLIKVLYVEDNLDEASLLKAGFNKCDRIDDIVVMDDGEKAEDYLKKTNGYESAPTPSLIILDLNLPKKHGLELLKAIKSDASLRNIPIIILTNSNSDKDVTSAYNQYANCFINKPDQIDEIHEMTDAICDFWVNSAVLSSKRTNNEENHPAHRGQH